LGRGELSEATKAGWFALGLMLPPVLAPGSLRVPAGGPPYVLAVFLVITIGGVVLCHRANAAGDGRNLVERMVCLSPPLWIVTYAAYWVAVAAYAKLGPPPLPPPQNPEELEAWAAARAQPTYLYVLLFTALYATFTGALVHFVRRAATASSGRRPPTRISSERPQQKQTQA
jgi:hypothetical protein